MKLIPILTAVLVSVGLYFLIFQRDTLLDLAADSPFVADSAAPDAVADIAEPPAPDMDSHTIRVVALRSTARTVESAVILRGRTEAARQVTVASETAGQVNSEPLRKGTYVETGDLLCQLDPGTRESTLAEARARLTEARGRVPEAEAAVAEANARTREADINVNAARQLSQEGFASETRLVSAEAAAESALAGVQRARSAVESAKAGIESAQAAVATATREIDRLTIEAPFSGLLETDTAELGVLMQPGSACATIIQLNPIKLVGFVPEADVDKVQVGARAGARLTNGDQVAGHVTFLSRSADNQTRTYRVEITVDNDDLALSDGQTIEILIAAEGRTAHLIPQSALTLDDDGRLGVRTIGAGNATVFMPVSLLRDTIDGVWVTDLPEQVDIITVGQEFVIDGVVVTPTFSKANG